MTSRLGWSVFCLENTGIESGLCRNYSWLNTQRFFVERKACHGPSCKRLFLDHAEAHGGVSVKAIDAGRPLVFELCTLRKIWNLQTTGYIRCSLCVRTSDTVTAPTGVIGYTHSCPCANTVKTSPSTILSVLRCCSSKLLPISGHHHTVTVSRDLKTLLGDFALPYKYHSLTTAIFWLSTL